MSPSTWKLSSHSKSSYGLQGWTKSLIQMFSVCRVKCSSFKMMNTRATVLLCWLTHRILKRYPLPSLLTTLRSNYKTWQCQPTLDRDSALASPDSAEIFSETCLFFFSQRGCSCHVENKNSKDKQGAIIHPHQMRDSTAQITGQTEGVWHYSRLRTPLLHYVLPGKTVHIDIFNF